jgi:hypothetical protein
MHFPLRPLAAGHLPLQGEVVGGAARCAAVDEVGRVGVLGCGVRSDLATIIRHGPAKPGPSYSG